MKKSKLLLTFIAGVAMMSLFSFKMTFDAKKNTAEVDQEEGVYIFYHAKPVMEYEYIGTYKVGMVWDDKPRLLFAKLVKKTKEKFPNCDGIIIDNEMGKCDAIKFK